MAPTRASAQLPKSVDQFASFKAEILAQIVAVLDRTETVARQSEAVLHRTEDVVKQSEANFAKLNEELLTRMLEVFKEKFESIKAKFAKIDLDRCADKGSLSCLGKVPVSPSITSTSDIKQHDPGGKLGHVSHRTYNSGGKMVAQGPPKGGNELYKRLSHQEKQYRKANNLCWKCNESWGPGHACKLEYLNLIIVNDDVDFEHVQWLSDELDNSGKVVELSKISCWDDCNALEDEAEKDGPRKLIVIIGSINGEIVRILIDTGAIRSFIDIDLAQKLGLNRKMVRPYYVKVADGHQVRNNIVCTAAKIELTRNGRRFILQGHSLAADDEIQDILRSVNPVRIKDGQSQHKRLRGDYHDFNPGKRMRRYQEGIISEEATDTFSVFTVGDCKDSCAPNFCDINLNCPQILESMETQLVLASTNAGISCWELRSGAGQPYAHFRSASSPPHGLTSIVFPDGNRVIAASQIPQSKKSSGSVFYWTWNKVDTGDLLAKRDAHLRGVTCLVLSEDKSLLISGSEDGAVRMWSLYILKVTDIAVGFGVCNAVIVSSSEDRTCKIWRLSRGKLLRSIKFPSIIDAVVLHPVEHVFFAGGRDGKIYEAALSAQVKLILVMGNISVALQVNIEDGMVRVWNAKTLHIVRVFRHDAKVSSPGPVSNVLVISQPLPRMALTSQAVSSRRHELRPLKMSSDSPHENVKAFLISDDHTGDSNICVQTLQQKQINSSFTSLEGDENCCAGIFVPYFPAYTVF
ncbi:OLC1v1038405C1 [Oldenlandia corymbosa var. corymbosa]|uniref:OLC1v1038405C1 n=1 Tax=Oldenlandia corymbosa var. corymbosa TaxID=529605 RepID=A0AAV1D0N9_OLDCO|nr:OLC1v1038405C1 [Oldenlandia corymbosa var. corymbosa]